MGPSLIGRYPDGPMCVTRRSLVFAGRYPHDPSVLGTIEVTNAPEAQLNKSTLDEQRPESSFDDPPIFKLIFSYELLATVEVTQSTQLKMVTQVDPSLLACNWKSRGTSLGNVVLEMYTERTTAAELS